MHEFAFIRNHNRAFFLLLLCKLGTMPEYRVVRTIYDHFFDFENRAPLFLARGFDIGRNGVSAGVVLCGLGVTRLSKHSTDR